jgi:long-chain acyl-CoA synthetase
MPFMATVILPLLAGATVVIENDLRHIRDSLQKYRPTVFFGVPGLYDLMLRSFATAAESKGKLSQFRQLLRISKAVKGATAINLGPLVFRPVHKALGGRLRFMVSGGAALNPQTQADYLALGLPLIQGWGMSEASPLIAVQPFSSSKFLFTRYYERHLGSVGPAAPGVHVRLADVPDKGIRVVNDGEGEILARGDNIFMGYWDAPEATNAVKSQGWLATGDLGRIAPDGSIYLTGRSKNVIVLDSGEKVQPEELELLLSQSELISEVCVIGRIVRGKTVVAAVIHPAEVATGPASTRSADDFRAELQVAVERICKRVATYKRIGLIEVALEPLPRTALGKIARASI